MEDCIFSIICVCFFDIFVTVCILNETLWPCFELVFGEMMETASTIQAIIIMKDMYLAEADKSQTGTYFKAHASLATLIQFQSRI